MSDETDADSPRWEHRLDVLLSDGVSGFRCPLCGEDVEATLDDLASYDRVKGHLLAHDPTLLAGALVEARAWARHGYEIGQESCSWTADSDEPTWMTEQYHAPCAACGWRNGAHADGCAAAGPDEFVIEDGSRTMRPVRADDYGPAVALTDLFLPIVGWAVVLADGTVRDVEMKAQPDEHTWADMTYCMPEGAVVRAVHFGAPATERENRLREALGHVSRWCHGIAAKAKTQGNFPLEATAPRIAEEIGRALTGEPLAYADPTPSPETAEVMAWLSEHGQTS